MFDSNTDTQGDRSVGASSVSVRRIPRSAAEKAAIIRETLVPGARISEVARRWQVDPQQIYQWRHSERATSHRPPMRGRRAAVPEFVPIVTDAMPAEAAVAARLATPVIEVRLAGAVVRVTRGLDTATLTAVLRAVRASAGAS